MSPEPRLPHRERCDTCGGHGHDPHIECMHGDVAGVCIDDLCQDGDTCPGCGGSGWDDGMADDDDLPTCANPDGTLHRGPDAEVDGYVSFDPFVETQRVKSHAESFAEGEKAATERIVACLHGEADEFERIGKVHGRPNMVEWATTLRVSANAIADGTHPGLRSSTEGEDAAHTIQQRIRGGLPGVQTPHR